MRIHEKLTSLMAASLALVLWGCSGEQVETGRRKGRPGS